MRNRHSEDNPDRARWLKPLGRSLLLSSLLAAGIVCAPIVAGADNSGPKVKTAEGPVTGFTKNGVNIFLGIPYAAPPVGKLRWQPPQPVKKWKDTLDATQYGNTCPQVTELGAFAGPTSINEDCLYLNVFTTNKNSNKKKPVIVWIHGGGNVDGESNDYDASKLATGGPNGVETVVVVINYRLGLFGFFSHASINTEGHLWGNYGILDQQAALRWVQRNIAQFGGDPTRVALGGQSAGAVDTGANQISPLAQGLFNRAIYQSAPGFFSTLISADTALSAGTAFATAANCPGSNAAAAKCLRNLSAARVLQLQGTPNASSPYVAGFFVDGTVIPRTPEQAFSTGQYNKMPIMGGSVRDEGNFGIGITEYFSGPPQAPQTPDAYQSAINASFGANASAVLAQYPLSDYGNNTQLAYNRVSTDPSACRSLHVEKLWAQKVPLYAYEFNYEDSPYYFPQMPGFKAGAAHTIDIQFLFPNWHGGPLGVNLDQTTGQPRELNNQESKLSDQLVAAWTNFAKTGNPNGKGNSPWPRFTTNAQTFLSQNLHLSTLSATDYRTIYKCDFWDPLLTY